MPHSVLDYTSYLKTLLVYPVTENFTDYSVDLTANVTFLCLDPESGVQEACFTADFPPNPEISGDVCVNVVKSVVIRLKTLDTKMQISESSVSVTLTSLSLVDTHVTQSFSVTYQPDSQTQLTSGNFGYLTRSAILSGKIAAGAVIMSSNPDLRVLSLFKSADCKKVRWHTIEFGVGFYTGCKLELPFYNVADMTLKTVDYCNSLRNVTGNLMGPSAGIVVGTTGRASVSDPTQWVFVQDEPLPPSGEASENAIR